MVKVTIEFNYDWMITQIGNEINPIEYTDGLFSRFFGDDYKIVYNSVSEICFLVNNAEKETVVNKIESLVKADNYLSADNFTMNVETEDEEEKSDSDDELLGVKEIKLGKFNDKAENKEEEKKDSLEKIVDEVHSLIGAGEFKKLIHELIDVAPQITAHKTQKSFAFQSYLFAINDGCGIGRYVKILYDVLDALDIFKKGRRPASYSRTLSASGKGDSDEKILMEEIELIDKECVENSVICFDLRNWVNKLGDPAFKNFLFKLRKFEEDFVFIFQVPFVEPYALKNIEREIADVMYIKTVSFRPYNNEELKEIAVRDLDEFGYSCDDEALEIIFQRINEEKNYGRFYGEDTVKKVVDETIFTKQLTNARNGKDDTYILKEDIKSLCSTYSSGEKSGKELLDELIGLESVKKTLADIIAQVKFAKQSSTLKTPCIHMRFTGNPGTGKTTVARILGLLMKENGILRNGYFFECMGRDLCGQYIGETSPKTQNKCRDAYGSVLFIDEAYSLYNSASDGRDYGKEALTALIAEMENHRDDLIVIMAGYSDDMKTLMDGNSGLKSRMPYEIYFPNYTREELASIFMSMAKKDFDVEDGLNEKVSEYFGSLPDDFVESKDFANARFVRNLFERTWSKSASRSMYENSDRPVVKIEDFTSATAESEFSDFNIPKKVTLGF